MSHTDRVSLCRVHTGRGHLSRHPDAHLLQCTQLWHALLMVCDKSTSMPVVKGATFRPLTLRQAGNRLDRTIPLSNGLPAMGSSVCRPLLLCFWTHAYTWHPWHRGLCNQGTLSLCNMNSARLYLGSEVTAQKCSLLQLKDSGFPSPGRLGWHPHLELLWISKWPVTKKKHSSHENQFPGASTEATRAPHSLTVADSDRLVPQ